MLRKRLLTVLTFNAGVLFRTKWFQPDYRYTANFVDSWSIDEIVLLDISRSEFRDPALFQEVVSSFSAKCFVPLCVGGGIRNLDDVKRSLDLGGDKVSINTMALEEPEFITRVAKRYGSQCVVVSIDAKREGERYRVYKDCGRAPTEWSPESWARRAEELGAGEILLTSMDKDGSLEGYDNELNRRVCSAVKIPVIVCGGAGKWQDFVDGFVQGGAAAVGTANIYHFTETSIRSAKQFLAKNGICVRG